MESFLLNCGLDATIVKTFLHHNITLEQLHQLTEEEIKELIPKIGDRKHFKRGIKELTQSKDVESDDLEALKLTEKPDEPEALTLTEKPDEPEALKLTENHPTKDEIKKCIEEILSYVDYDKTTMNIIFAMLESKYPKADFSNEKDFVRSTVNSFVRTLEEVGIGTHPDKSDSGNNQVQEEPKRSCKNLVMKARNMPKKRRILHPTNNNTTAKQDFIKKILNSDKELFEKLIQKATNCIRKCTPLLYEKNSRRIREYPLFDFEKTALNCTFCYRKIKPQYRQKITAKGKKGKVQWNLYNFKRHLNLAHSENGPEGITMSDTDDDDDDEKESHVVRKQKRNGKAGKVAVAKGSGSTTKKSAVVETTVAKASSRPKKSTARKSTVAKGSVTKQPAQMDVEVAVSTIVAEEVQPIKVTRQRKLNPKYSPDGDYEL